MPSWVARARRSPLAASGWTARTRGAAPVAARPCRIVPGPAESGGGPGVGLRASRRGTEGQDEATLDERLVAEAKAVGLDRSLLTRPLNVDLSGGEKKRTEMVQLGVLQPALCILDEIDSGLDVDALGDVARRLQRATVEWGVGFSPSRTSTDSWSNSKRTWCTCWSTGASWPRRCGPRPAVGADGLRRLRHVKRRG